MQVELARAGHNALVQVIRLSRPAISTGHCIRALEGESGDNARAARCGGAVRPVASINNQNQYRRAEGAAGHDRISESSCEVYTRIYAKFTYGRTQARMFTRDNSPRSEALEQCSRLPETRAESYLLFGAASAHLAMSVFANHARMGLRGI